MHVNIRYKYVFFLCQLRRLGSNDVSVGSSTQVKVFNNIFQ